MQSKVLLVDIKRVLPNYDVWYAMRWRCITPLCSEKQVYGWFIASSISAFIVGVTEPIEFAFMFVAPVLFVIHALLTGLSLFIALFHWTEDSHLVQV